MTDLVRNPEDRFSCDEAHIAVFGYIVGILRVATVREKSLENEIFSRSGKSQGISILVREN